MSSPPHHRLDRRRAGYYRPAPPGSRETAATLRPGLFRTYSQVRRALLVWALVALGLIAGLGAVGLAIATVLRLLLSLFGGAR